MNEERTIRILSPLPAQEEIRVPAHTAVRIVLPLSDATGAHHIDVVLDGPGADAEIYGVFCGTDADALHLTVNTIHSAPNTRGLVRIGAVLGGNSSFQFSGMIRIHQGAHGSNAELHQNSLLLSNDARAHAIPALEIEANDVKAFHAATAGPIHPAQVFFLMSRGLPQPTAAEYIVRGFVAPIARLLPQHEQHMVMDRLTTLFSA